MKTTPRILRKSIYLFAEPDVFAEQEHERSEEAGGGGEHEQKPDEKAAKAKADFYKQFGAKGRAPASEGGDPKNEVNQADVEQRKADEARHRQTDEQHKKEGEEARKKAGSNVPKIIEDKRAAEKARDEAAAKVEKYEKEEKPQLEAKIAELQKKIDSGDHSTAKEAEFQTKITELETKMREKEDSLVNENSKLKKQLAFHDLANDPDFIQHYQDPVVAAHGEATEVLGENTKLQEAFHRALTANSASLRAPNDATRRNAEKERDQILSGIVQELGTFEAGRFTSAATEYIRRAKEHAIALRDHEQTTSKLKQQAQDRANRAQADRLETWDRTYRATADTYKEQETLPETDAKIAKELGHNVEDELKKSGLLASKVIKGQSTMTEAIDLVHKGRIYPALTARIAALQKQLADRDGVISKLRKGGSGGGENNGNGGDTKPATKEEKKEKFMSRFSASREGVGR